MLMNPLAWGSNLVYIPYCTSDLWLGDSLNDENEGIVFLYTSVDQLVVEAELRIERLRLIVNSKFILES